MQHQDVTALILAGGAGRRVGGSDKGLIQWQGRPLVEHVVGRIAPQAGSVLISCNRNLLRYRKIAACITDQRPGFPGPLAGIAVAAGAVKTEFLLLTPCDTPLLPLDLVAKLKAPLMGANSNVDIAYAHDGVREQYLCAIIRTSLLAGAENCLNQGIHAVKHWYAKEATAAVYFADQTHAFANFNRIEDIRPG